MLRSFVIVALCFAAYLFSGAQPVDLGYAAGGDPLCDVSSLKQKPCNDYLPGCPQKVYKCHTGTSPHKLCDEGGGIVECDNFQNWPECLGENKDAFSQDICTGPID